MKEIFNCTLSEILFILSAFLHWRDSIPVEPTEKKLRNRYAFFVSNKNPRGLTFFFYLILLIIQNEENITKRFIDFSGIKLKIHRFKINQI